MIKILPLSTLLLIFISSCTDQQHTDKAAYIAGFKTIQTKDSSRLYKPETDQSDYLHYRPLDIDIWYPAKAPAKDSPIVFGNILGLLEKRANYYTASNAGDGITQQLAQYFAEGLQCSDSDKILNFTTETFQDAEAADSKFPLVIYLSSFNGMSYENFRLFEELAKRGFVVVSISSIGRYPGDMTMKNEDLQEQVNDAIAAINLLKENKNIDFTQIGIIGYSWGGLSGSILASKIPDIRCFISLDGSEFRRYGQATQENTDFDGIRYSADFVNMQITAPYLRLESLRESENDKTDSVYNFSEKLHGQKHMLTIDSARHEDFSSLPLVVKESGGCSSNKYYTTISTLTVSFLEDHLKGKKIFPNAVEKTLHQKSE